MSPQRLIDPEIDPSWYNESDEAEATRLAELDALQASWDADNSEYDEGNPRNKAEPSEDEEDDDIESSEQNADTDDGQTTADTAATDNEASEGLYENSAESNPKKFSFANITKRQTILGGGILGTILAIFAGFTIISGPLQVIHFGKVLSRIHFSNNDKMVDNRFARLYKYARTIDAPQRRNLGIAGNYFADVFEGRLKTSGIEPVYGKNVGKRGTLIGFNVDPNSEGGKRLIAEARAKGVTIGEPIPETGRVSIDLGEDGRRFKNAILGSATSSTEDGKVLSAISKRMLSLRGNVSGFHPIKDLKSKGDEKFANYANRLLEKWREARKNGSVDTEAKASGGVDKKTGATTPDDVPAVKDGGEIVDETRKAAAAAEKAAAAADNTIDVVDNAAIVAGKSAFKANLRKVTGAAAVVSLICGLDKLGDSIPKLKYLNLVLPMMRIGMDIVTAGSQAQAGKDINMQALGVFSKSFNSDKGSWASAAAVQAGLGGDFEGRPDLSEGLKPNSASKPEFFVILSEILGTVKGSGVVCNAITSTLGSLFVTGIDLVAAAFTGGATFAFSAAANAGGYFASEAFMDDVVGWLVGKPLSLLPTGPLLGNVASYGVRLSANDVAISRGGTELTQQESAALLKRRLDLERQELKTASVFERYLSIGNDRSLLSKVAFEQPELSTPRNLVGSVIFGSPLKQLASIIKGLSSPAYAASSYSYGFPEYGFSTDELDDPAFDDPYANEQKVEQIGLDKLNNEYGNPCFNVTIDPSTGLIRTSNEVKGYDEIPEKCKDRNNQELKAYRFYLADKNLVESIMCKYTDSLDSCNSLGFGASQSQGGASAAVDCSAAVGNEKIVCAARNYPEIRYAFSTAEKRIANWQVDDEQYAMRGGNNPEAWLKKMNNDISFIQQKGLIECSGYATVSLFVAFGYRTTAGCSGGFTSGQDKNIVRIQLSEVRPGDFLTIGNTCQTETTPGHIAIFAGFNSDGTFNTYESSAGKNAKGEKKSGLYIHPKQKLGGSGVHDFKYAARYVGPGSAP